MRDRENGPRSGGDENSKLHKGEQEPTRHKGAPSVSNKGKEPHRKDESDGNGADRNTTKKGSNAV